MTKSKSKSKKGEKGKEASTLPNSSDSKVSVMRGFQA